MLCAPRKLPHASPFNPGIAESNVEVLYETTREIRLAGIRQSRVSKYQ